MSINTTVSPLTAGHGHEAGAENDAEGNTMDREVTATATSTGSSKEGSSIMRFLSCCFAKK